MRVVGVGTPLSPSFAYKKVVNCQLTAKTEVVETKCPRKT